MHGRLKVKTTAEQEAEKQKERKKKLALFTEGSEKAKEKRNLKEYDSEALSITGQLLQHNPDFYTQWNFRKEILQYMNSEKADSEGEVQDLLENELHLTEVCLRKNPKSYGAWHHRSWVLKNMPKPNWKKEINICSKYLQIDERNFHCWDHRRLVSQLANESPEDELSFTLKKIEENFSNYSAWHYRSSLLPLVHPGKNTLGPCVQQDSLLKEYELVQNAAFTDPNDQSAWFYHRWLLGRVALETCLLCCHVDRLHRRVVSVFSKPMKESITEKISVLINGAAIICTWRSTEDENYASTVWYCDVPASDTSFEVEIIFENGEESDRLKCPPSVETVWNEKLRDTLYSSELSAATSEVLQVELESCQQLLDLEPENKWTLLTCVLLLRALNSVTHEATILDYLDKLVTVDATRRNYYADLKSKCVIENALSTFLQNASTTLNLSMKSLTLFCHGDHIIFLRSLDVSNNRLNSLNPLRYLIMLEELLANDNQIQDCSGLETMTYLHTLNISNNCIKELTGLDALKCCKNLHYLHVHDNPISWSDEFIQKLENIWVIPRDSGYMLTS